MQYLVSVIDDTAGLATPDETTAAIRELVDACLSDGGRGVRGRGERPPTGNPE